MIYYVTIVDMSGETGVSKWDYIHPDTPKELYEHLKDVRDYIPPMTYGIVSVVSKELFGDRLRRMELTDMQIVIGKLVHGEKEYYVFFLADIKDNPRAVWRIFMAFYEEERETFDRILSFDIVEVADINRLRNAFSAFLVNFFRKSALWGARDNVAFIISLLLSTAIMGILVAISWLINHQYNLINEKTSWVTYTYIIILMNFIIPGPIIGYITQYRRHAEVISLINGVIWTLIISSIYYTQLQIGIRNSFNITVSPGIFYIFVLISGIIYGAALMLVSVPFATFFETRKLTSPRKKFVIMTQHMESEKKEESQLAPQVQESEIVEESLEKTISEGESSK